MSLFDGVRDYFSSTPEQEQEASRGEQNISNRPGIDCAECDDGEFVQTPVTRTGVASESASAEASASVDQVGSAASHGQGYEHSTQWSQKMICDNCNNRVDAAGTEATGNQQAAAAGGAEAEDNRAEAGMEAATDTGTAADTDAESEATVDTVDAEAGATTGSQEAGEVDDAGAQRLVDHVADEAEAQEVASVEDAGSGAGADMERSVEEEAEASKDNDAGIDL